MPAHGRYAMSGVNYKQESACTRVTAVERRCWAGNTNSGGIAGLVAVAGITVAVGRPEFDRSQIIFWPQTTH